MVEAGRIHVVDVELGAQVPPEGSFLYARDTDKVYKSDGTTLAELAGGGGGLDAEGAQDAVGSMVDTSLTYVDATPLLKVTALSGDVTSTGANVTTIANDAVTFAKIQNITDDRLLGRSAGSSGDMQEITVGSSLDLSSATLALPAWMNKYNPMRPPASVGTGGIQDEFIGGVTMTFNGWGNQESSTATATRDGLELYHPADATGNAVYWFTGPNGASTDWAFHARVSCDFVASYNFAGITILATGTEATPTLMYNNHIWASGTNRNAGIRSKTSYTSAETLVGTDQQARLSHFLRFSYVSSTKVLTGSFSDDGYIYNRLSTTTLAAHPTTSFGLTISSFNATHPASGFFHFVRVRTDADMLNPGS